MLSIIYMVTTKKSLKYLKNTYLKKWKGNQNGSQQKNVNQTQKKAIMGKWGTNEV